MASVALSLVGSAIGGPIGGMVGGFIGGLIDNVLFPQPKPSPPAITTSTYGNTIPLLYGPLTRVGCNMIWTSGWQPAKGKSAKLASVKGAPPQYNADLAFLVAEGPLDPSWILKIFANGSVIFDASVATSTPTPDSNGVVTWDLTHQAHKVFDTLTVYPGNFTQVADPTIEAALGVGNVPGYRGSAYFVITGLQGTPFGNSVPVLNVLCRAQATMSLGAIVYDIAGRCGLNTNEISTSALTSDIGGYAITSQLDGVSALQPLALCYDFDLAEVAGQLRCQPRGEPPLCTLLNAQFNGYAAGGNRPNWEWPDDPDLTLPKTAALTFVDPDRDGNDNTQSAQRETGSSQSNLSTRVGVTLTSAQARGVCDRLLWEAHFGRQQFNGDSDDRLWFVDPGRTYAMEVPFGYEMIRPTKKSRGANNVSKFNAKRDYSGLYASSAPAASAALAANGLGLGGPVNAPVFIEPPSTFPGLTQPTLFIALSGGDGTTANPAWAGCDVYVSTDNSDYVLAGVQFGPSTMGKLTAALTSYGGSNPDPTLTGTHVLSVDMSESGGEPQGVSSTDAADALIPYFVGGEYVSAQTVTGVGGGVYNLTHLWRHLYGSSGSSHSIGDPFVRLDEGVFRYPLPAPYIGRLLYFRFVSAGETLASATTYTFTPGGAGYGLGGSGLPQASSAPTVATSPAGNVVAIPANVAEDNVTQYQVLRAAGSGASIGSASVIATVAGGTGTYTDTTATPGAAYTYFTVPVNVVGPGTGSGGVSVTTAAAGSPRTITASANLGAGAFVNIFTSGGAIRVRPADATDDSKPADGFVLAAVTAGNPATVYGLGAQNVGAFLSAGGSLTPGTEYFLSAAGDGGLAATAPASSGNLQQTLGKADSATALTFTPQIIGMDA